tara:strand:- start:56 stop:895 length:840 start_codon:yes stop_codon:yes gene_type:complete
MKTLKKLLKAVLGLIKSSLSLTNLTDKEISGNFGWRTNFCFLPKTNVRLPFSLGRTVRGCSFVNDIDKDPFAKIVKQVLKSDHDEHAIAMLIECYEGELSLFGKSPMGSLEPKMFLGCPPWAIVMPWEKISFQNKLAKYPNVFKNNRGSFGVNFHENISHDSFKFMYSRNVARSQVEQTRRLIDSIKSKGILEIGQLPLVYVLRDGRRWKWCMTGEGNHRAYIFALLKQSDMLVEVYTLVDREKVDSWPNVINGNYTREEALPVFDSFFEGTDCIRGMA